MSKLPRKDMNIVMGDINAKVGSYNTNHESVIGRHGLGTCNENGERLLAFCSFNEMVIGGTIFPHKDIHKATWQSPDGRTENQIDHFCISKKLRRSIDDVRVLRGADVGSDHIYLFWPSYELSSRNIHTKPNSVDRNIRSAFYRMRKEEMNFN